MTALQNEIDNACLEIEELSITGETEQARQKLDEIKAYGKLMDCLQFAKPKEKLSLREEIAKEFNIPAKDMFTRTRKREYVNARQTYIYLMMTTKLPSDPVNDRGIRIQQLRERPKFMERHTGWDHSTLYHSCEAIENYCNTEIWFREFRNELILKLRSGDIAMPDVLRPVK
jgi:chromosomal replication initiation ATPase DnaA